jgi:outer membrane protein
MTIKYNLLIAATLFATSSAMAGDFSLGAGAVFNESPYKGYNENTTAVPLISYEGDRFMFARPRADGSCGKTQKMNSA